MAHNFAHLHDTFFESLAGLIAEGVMIHDSECILYINERGRRILSPIQQRNLVGCALEEIVHCEDRERVLEAIRGGSSDMPVDWYELRFRLQSGEYVEVLVRSTVADTGENRCFLTVFNNIYELKRSELARRRLEESLDEAKRLEAVGRLAGGIAHEFNNLLQVIAGYTDLHLAFTEPDDERYEGLSEVRDAAIRATALTRQLVTFSRRGELDPEYTNANELVTGISKMLKQVVGSHIEIELDKAQDLPSVFVDSGAVQRMLLSLCVRARDCMPSGGRITLSTALRYDFRPPGREGVRLSPGKYVSISVTDTGSGIPASLVGGAFAGFFSESDLSEIDSDEASELSTAFATAERHGGCVYVESDDSSGTTFSVYLPATEPPEAERYDEPTAASEMEKPQRIFVAEDDGLVRKLLVTVLESAGYSVSVVEDGAKALRTIEAEDFGADLAILDVIMPKHTGIEVMHAIRDRDFDMPILFTTGYSSLTIDPDKLPPGTELLEKPYAPADLLDRVRSCISRNHGFNR